MSAITCDAHSDAMGPSEREPPLTIAGHRVLGRRESLGRLRRTKSLWSPPQSTRRTVGRRIETVLRCEANNGS